VDNTRVRPSSCRASSSNSIGAPFLDDLQVVGLKCGGLLCGNTCSSFFPLISSWGTLKAFFSEFFVWSRGNSFLVFEKNQSRAVIQNRR